MPRAGQSQHPKPGVEQVLGPAGVHRPGPGVKPQTAAGHGLILRLFGPLGLDDDGPGPRLVGGQLGQKRSAQAALPVPGQDREVVQMADGAALRPDHQQIGRQRFPRKDAPAVGPAPGLGVQNHGQRLALAGREIPAQFGLIDA